MRNCLKNVKIIGFFDIFWDILNKMKGNLRQDVFNILQNFKFIRPRVSEIAGGSGRPPLGIRCGYQKAEVVIFLKIHAPWLLKFMPCKIVKFLL